MACITHFAPTMAMAATQVARVVHVEELRIRQLEGGWERTPLRMNWVAVTDSGQRLQMRWALSVDDG